MCWQCVLKEPTERLATKLSAVLQEVLNVEECTLLHASLFPDTSMDVIRQNYASSLQATVTTGTAPYVFRCVSLGLLGASFNLSKTFEETVAAHYAGQVSKAAYGDTAKLHVGFELRFATLGF